MRKLVSILILSFTTALLFGQDQPKTPAAKPEDVSSIEAIVKAFSEITSGPKGPRDWARFQSLFLPGAVMFGAGQPPISPEEFQKQAAPTLETQSFFVKETSRKVEKTESGATVTRTYEFSQQDNQGPEAKGVETFKLKYDGKRWWIESIEGKVESTSTVTSTGD